MNDDNTLQTVKEVDEIDWVAVNEALAKACEPLIEMFNAIALSVSKWYDELPDELKQQIEGKRIEEKKLRAKRDLDNKRRMARGGKWKAF